MFVERKEIKNPLVGVHGRTQALRSDAKRERKETLPEKMGDCQAVFE